MNEHDVQAAKRTANVQQETGAHLVDGGSQSGRSDQTVSLGKPERWWENAVIYQVYPRSFAGVGNQQEGSLAGVISRLDYLAGLGVQGIWLSPFYTSPLKDGGYDVANYRDVDPRFGTLHDFHCLVAHAHELGLKVIVDIVPNHTSDQHPWFQQALAAAPGSPERDRYIFRQGKGAHHELPPTNWISNFGGSAWQPIGDGWYYLHLFAAEQPDLNWDNPEVIAEFESILRFWLDQGVDGFRVDVSHGLKKDLREPLRDRENPEDASPHSLSGDDPLWDRDAVHEVYRGWRRVMNRMGKKYGKAIYAVGESWQPFSHRIYDYARADELGAVFDFSLLKANWSAAEYRAIITRELAEARRVGASPVWVMGNHDVPRLASRLALPVGTNVENWVTSNGTQPEVSPSVVASRARAAAFLFLGLPGTAYLYQGDELGLAEDLDLTSEQVQDPTWERSSHTFKGRDGCRIPLPWDARLKNFGFSDAEKTWLPQPSWFAQFSEAQEEADPHSVLNLYRTLLALRARWVAPASLDVELLDKAHAQAMGITTELTDAQFEAQVVAWKLSTGMIAVINCGDSVLTISRRREVVVNSSEETDEFSIPSGCAAWLR